MVNRRVAGILVVVVASLGISVSLYAQAGKVALPAKAIVDRALKTAQTENKTAMILFGASWCSWCKQLDALLLKSEFADLFSQNYVFAHLTIQESDDKKALENPGAQEMANAAGAGGSGVPVFLFLDRSGKTIATSMAMPNGGNIGHPVTPEEIKAFVGLLERTAPRMTVAARSQIAAYLSKQK